MSFMLQTCMLVVLAVCTDSPPFLGGNGSFVCGPRTPIGGQCTAQCDDGFRLIGSPVVACGAGATWGLASCTCEPSERGCVMQSRSLKPVAGWAPPGCHQKCRPHAMQMSLLRISQKD
jgi:hypothetical protein